MTEHRKDFSQLNDCLVDGDERAMATGRCTRWRAMGTSIMLQTIIGTALVLIPLLATGTLPTKRLDSGPIWTFGSSQPKPAGHPDAPGHRTTNKTKFIPDPKKIYQPQSFPDRPALIQETTIGESADTIADNGPIGDPNGDPHGIPLIFSSDRRVPPPLITSPKKPVLVRRSQMEPGALIHRVEPRYPAIPLQLRKEGVVELRAIIGTDGTIHSLEVLSGNPLFIDATLNAVRQWRYRPTLLNGEAVEVETRITVTYTLGK